MQPHLPHTMPEEDGPLREPLQLEPNGPASRWSLGGVVGVDVGRDATAEPWLGLALELVKVLVSELGVALALEKVSVSELQVALVLVKVAAM